ncbi:ABC transporter ATP-binding protein [Nitratireductor sp. XY-223]|uniref:ABC transporter ATP-binding protein n=1 Tax=Nitratireductor sp. XY-223 TaxID=2561926 RepID=UPI0010AA05D6|nr:ABC transporter ATP-binding protein [Nitratireductor sp. XY-223]
MTVVLETRGLEKRFDAVVAARDINAEIFESEVLGIIGSNGAGKTTFVNMVTGYLQPSSGQILYRGRDITGMETRDITRLGICRSFQIPQLFLELTALDNVLIALSVARERRPVLFRPVVTREIVDEALELLAKFRIEHVAHQEVTALPQGVRKLIDIAMATVANPDLLFLDEPTSGVSAEEKMDMMEVLISALQSTNTAVLFIEHDMEIIERFSPRVMAFYEGTILADGPTADVLRNEKVREFVVGQEFHRNGTAATMKGTA